MPILRKNAVKLTGALIGDYVGSRFEWHNIKTKNFGFLHYNCDFTDDSIMTLAIFDALLNSDNDYLDLSVQAIKSMQGFGRKYPGRGYGNHFYMWLMSDDPKPYNSYGNGAAMRVSGCGFAAKSADEAISLADKVTMVSHNHPEGMKGAEALAVAVYMAKAGAEKKKIRDCIVSHYYPLNFTLDEIRDTYTFDVSCHGTVPEALEAFFEADDFEDAVRNSVSIGGDSDTLAAITGALASAFYGVPDNIISHIPFNDEFTDIINRFSEKFPIPEK